jgi:2-amino-4-hydroxy-6-hydroxymethyldihydropteridine diphosphokinase
MSIVYIGLGSNLGDRLNNCLRALERLERNGLSVARQSLIHETEAWGFTDQPAFLNMVVEIYTARPPLELLALLKKIEKEMGRQETVRWGPRVIDLDILLYDEIVMKTEDLTIPHPLMQERVFVLKPLSELAEDYVHPVLKKRVGALLGEIHMKD